MCSFVLEGLICVLLGGCAADTVRLVRDLDDQETVEVDMSHSLVGPRHMTACVKFFSSYSTSNIHLKLRSTHLQDEYLVQMFKVGSCR